MQTPWCWWFYHEPTIHLSWTKALKRTVFADQSTVDQINFANKKWTAVYYWTAFYFYISSALCNVFNSFLDRMHNFSRCLAKIDRWATRCLIGTVLIIQAAIIQWNLGMENCNWFCKEVIYVTTIGYLTVSCKTRHKANCADDYFHACSEMPTVTHFA